MNALWSIMTLVSIIALACLTGKYLSNLSEDNPEPTYEEDPVNDLIIEMRAAMVVFLAEARRAQADKEAWVQRTLERMNDQIDMAEQLP